MGRPPELEKRLAKAKARRSQQSSSGGRAKDPKWCPECESFTKDWYGASSAYCRPCHRAYQRLQYHIRKHRPRLERKQRGRCAICRRLFSGLRGTPVVDHIHGSMKIRGVLCVGCNAALGNMGDDVKRLEAAVAYLREHPVEDFSDDLPS